MKPETCAATKLRQHLVFTECKKVTVNGDIIPHFAKLKMKAELKCHNKTGKRVGTNSASYWERKNMWMVRGRDRDRVLWECSVRFYERCERKIPECICENVKCFNHKNCTFLSIANLIPVEWTERHFSDILIVKQGIMYELATSSSKSIENMHYKLEQNKWEGVISVLVRLRREFVHKESLGWKSKV